jgi:hypothetical protein
MDNIKEILIDKLNKSVLIHGTSDKRTIELSKRLDLYIVAEQKAISYGN